MLDRKKLLEKLLEESRAADENSEINSPFAHSDLTYSYPIQIADIPVEQPTYLERLSTRIKGPS